MVAVLDRRTQPFDAPSLRSGLLRASTSAEKGGEPRRTTRDISMYYVYIIQCEDGSLYTGITNNLERRFLEHKDKSGGHYTATHKVEKIIHTEKFGTKNEALKREAQIKGWRREKKLALIRK